MSDHVIENSSSPIPALSLCTPDNVTITGHGTHDYPLRCIGSGGPVTGPNVLVASTNMPPGTVIYPPSDGVASPALADGAGGAEAIGLVSNPNGVAEAAVTEYSLIAGLLSFLTTDWDVVTGDSGGLTPGANYYLSTAIAGHLTTTPTSVFIGTAINATTMIMRGQGTTVTPAAPTVEHLAPSGSPTENFVIDPTLDVTFVTAGGHPAVGTLAAGTIDGFEKTVCMYGGDGGCQFTCALGGDTTITVTSAVFGAVILRWNDTGGIWQIAGSNNVAIS